MKFLKKIILTSFLILFLISLVFQIPSKHNLNDILTAKTKTVTDYVKNVFYVYEEVYKRAPKSVKDLYAVNNNRNIEFLEENQVPLDPFSPESNELKFIKNVQSISSNKDSRLNESISSYKLGGSGFIVYSVGPNEIDDKAINNGKEKDDIAVYIPFEK